MGSVDSNANRKKRGNENEIDLRIEKEIPTLTLDDNGAGGDLPVTRRAQHHRCAGQGCTASRRRAVQGAIARRRDAGAHAHGLESEVPSMASSTAARSPTGERAHRRASRGGAASSSPPRPPWPSPPLRGYRCVTWREKGEGERVARVSGNTGVAGFDPAMSRAE